MLLSFDRGFTCHLLHVGSTSLNFTQHVACVWPPCCDLLRHVATSRVLLAQILKWSNFSFNICDMLRLAGCCWLKFVNDQITHATFVDVAWCCNRLARFVQQCCAWACALVSFSTRKMPQHVETAWPNAVNMLHSTMLRSFGRSL